MSGQSAREALKEKDTSEVICFYKYIKHGRQEKISMRNGGLIFLKDSFCYQWRFQNFNQYTCFRIDVWLFKNSTKIETFQTFVKAFIAI